MTRSSDLGTIKDEEVASTDFNLSGCSAPSLTNSIYTNSDGDDPERADTCSVHTARSATYISGDLLMMPTVNHIVMEEKAVLAAKPEQSTQDTTEETKSTHKKEEYQVAFLECGVFPRYIRRAPVWLKMLMAMAALAILFGLSLYLGARILKETHGESSDDSDKSASDAIMEKDGDLMQWQVDDSFDATATTTMAPTPASTPSLHEWAQSLVTKAPP